MSTRSALKKKAKKQASDFKKKPKLPLIFYGIVSVCGWFAPPLAVVVRFGIGKDFFLNLVLTLCGYFPGHIHNFYLQNIRNNKGMHRTPKWAVRYGLIHVKDTKAQPKHQWANRYDERNPASHLQSDYADSPPESQAASEWDGVGPEPPLRSESTPRQRHIGFTPWSREIDPDEVMGGADSTPGSSRRTTTTSGGGNWEDQEEFYSTSGLQAEGASRRKSTSASKKENKGDRFDRMESARKRVSSNVSASDWERREGVGYYDSSGVRSTGTGNQAARAEQLDDEDGGRTPTATTADDELAHQF